MPEGSVADDGPVVPEGVAVRRALEAVSLQSARSLAFWLAPLFALFILSDSLLFEAPVDTILASYDAVLVVLFLGFWLVVRRQGIPDRAGTTAAAGVMLLSLPYLLTVLWVTGQPLQSTGLALWQVGLGMFLLSWPWLLALLLVSDGAWFAIVATLPPDEEWSQFGVLLLSASVLAIVAHGVRLRTYRRLEQLRIRERARQEELALALAEAHKAKEMRRLGEMKTRFVNVAAHELATPMTPILIQMRLLRPFAKDMPPQARKAVELLDRGLQRMGALVHDILDGSRLQAEKMPVTLRPLSLEPILAEAVEAYQEAARLGQVGLTLDAGGERLAVQGDAVRLHQVMANLLGNALKFTPKGGAVRVSARREAGRVLVEVRDTGAGFPPTQAVHLFQPFSQLHEPTPTRRGTGLGLYIVRGIIESHGGSIGAESRGEGEGSRFWFTLPLDGNAR
ncbi:MAG TPA: HAMP domain-containing sensor histidine kinase [Candidatus Thermoplasmatota archaeon]|nr:HAMP domain-containing sensor histidine kinase [Candidatus Thermoplasmatota archaeon]